LGTSKNLGHRDSKAYKRPVLLDIPFIALVLSETQYLQYLRNLIHRGYAYLEELFVYFFVKIASADEVNLSKDLTHPFSNA
jgi:hypothetical protein